jgi:hypothetical protein
MKSRMCGVGLSKSETVWTLVQEGATDVLPPVTLNTFRADLIHSNDQIPTETYNRK